jgi:hypothetical protein
MRRLVRIGPFILLGVVGCSSTPALPAFQVDTILSREIEPLPAEASFTAVRDIVVSDGFLWVLDGAPPFMTRIDRETGEALRFGSEGKGPGEFLDPWAIQPAVDTESSHVLVWDLGALRVSEFDQRGQLLTSDRLSDEGRVRARSDIRDVSYGDPFRVRSDGQRFFMRQYPGRIDRTADLLWGSLVSTNRLMELGRPLVSVSDHVTDDASRFREWAPLPFWDFCDGTVAFWSPALAAIRWLHPANEGRVQRDVPLDADPLRPRDIQRYLRRMARLELGPEYENAAFDYDALARRYRDRFPAQRPLATDLRCESRDVAWIRLFDTRHDPLGRGTEWLRISARGSVEGYRFPPTFTPFRFQEGGVLGMLEVSGGHHQILALWRQDPTNP